MKSVQAVLAGKPFARLRAMQRRMRALQDAVGAVLAQHAITADCRLRLDGDELRLTAASAAELVRIRQILPTLRRSLKTAGFPVAKIRLSRHLDGAERVK